MKTKPVIAIDLDSTINNLDEVWMQRYNSDYGDNLTPSDMVHWDLTKYIKPECGVKIFDYLKEDGFFANLGIRENAREVIEELQEHFDLYIVTAYHYMSCKDKGIYVERELPNFDIKRLVFLNDKFLFSGADYLIDDGGHNAEAFPNKVLLVDTPCPWNHYLGSKFQRVHNWGTDIREFFIEERMKLK